jgi:hypothetical protein
VLSRLSRDGFRTYGARSVEPEGAPAEAPSVTNVDAPRTGLPAATIRR